jgi:hypothetical protein
MVSMIVRSEFVSCSKASWAGVITHTTISNLKPQLGALQSDEQVPFGLELVIWVNHASFALELQFL